MTDENLIRKLENLLHELKEPLDSSMRKFEDAYNEERNEAADAIVQLRKRAEEAETENARLKKALKEICEGTYGCGPMVLINIARKALNPKENPTCGD